jgi:hypothetical protein
MFVTENGNQFRHILAQMVHVLYGINDVSKVDLFEELVPFCLYTLVLSKYVYWHEVAIPGGLVPGVPESRCSCCVSSYHTQANKITVLILLL